jgi:hypothetical protein
MSRGSSRNVAATVAVVILALAGCGEQSIDDRVADQAAALVNRLESRGSSISAETGAALFGDDGDALCAAAGSVDELAGTALVGHRFALRKTEVSSDDVEFARAAIDVYCPEHRETFDDYVAGLVIGDDSGA